MKRKFMFFSILASFSTVFLSIQCANNNQKNRNVLHTPRERERERDWEEPFYVTG
ncbi:Hypothetical protein MCYN_0103 [Mycoplasmopsis cynos C142]|uniref:Lipoprotein n=1 Tax=Mycoplasmopsis cynos (strain C142) TaxID=1246955 RepID=L0RW93_MYCC1|nr:Hypothetical protein MCYN_0103 [Mycoplasmopsis cynos C142]